MTERRVYDRALLDEVLARDGAALVGEYENINSSSKIKFICKCGNEGAKGIYMVINNTGLFCKSCSTKIGTEKVKKYFLDKYGVENASQVKEIQNKKKETTKLNYGVENPFQSDKVKDKIKETNLEKYGSEYAIQSQEVKEKSLQTSIAKYGCHHTQNEDVKTKIRETNIEKYGIENPLKNKDIYNKVKKTNLEKYGVEVPTQNKIIYNKIEETNLKKYGAKNPAQNQEVKDKIKNTFLQKYGVSCSLHADEIQKKVIQTNLQRYGVENPAQNLEIQEKTQRNAKKFKEYKMPSGQIRKVQGYEPFALDALLKTYTEDQIKTDRKDVPRIPYTVDGKQRYYFPDIYIPHVNTIVEVKSTWTYKCKADNVDLKKKATEEKGYAYELWCFDAKGNRVEV